MKSHWLHRRCVIACSVALGWGVWGGAIAGCEKADASPTTPASSNKAAASPASAPKPEQSVEVTLAKVDRAQLPVRVDVVGTIEGMEQSMASAKVAGRVIEVSADLGDRLAPGSVLARIDPVDYELLVNQRTAALNEALAVLGLTEVPDKDFDPARTPLVLRAEAQRDNAQAKYNRVEGVFNQSPPPISPQEFADIQTQLQVAKRDYDVALLEARAALAAVAARQADLSSAKQQLADTTVRTPALSGSLFEASSKLQSDLNWAVAQRMIAPGDLVQPGTAMFRLVMDNPVKLRAAVTERFSSSISVGQAADVTVEGMAAPFSGVVSRISPVVDVASRTFQIEILVQNKQRELRPGNFARGRITVGQRDDVVSVPESALQQFAGVDRVFSVGAQGKAAAHSVTVLQRAEGRIIVPAEELKGVEQVIASGVGRVSAGVTVKTAAE